MRTRHIGTLILALVGCAHSQAQSPVTISGFAGPQICPENGPRRATMAGVYCVWGLDEKLREAVQKLLRDNSLQHKVAVDIALVKFKTGPGDRHTLRFNCVVKSKLDGASRTFEHDYQYPELGAAEDAANSLLVDLAVSLRSMDLKASAD
jgi:hypothetical protein